MNRIIRLFVVCVTCLASVTWVTAQNVALFYDGAFVDTTNTCFGEAYNVREYLLAQGFTVDTFNGTTEAIWTSNLFGKDILVIPENETTQLFTSLDVGAQLAIQTFVNDGGRFLVFGDSNDHFINLLNGVFGYSLLPGPPAGATSVFNDQAAIGTCFEGSAPTLTNHSDVTLAVNSMPANKLCLYNDVGNPSAISVAAFSYGNAGGIVGFVGWDYFDGGPGCANEDADWNAIINCLLAEELLVLPFDCTFNCQDHVYLSFGLNCTYTVTAADVLKNADTCFAPVQVSDEYGQIIGNTLTSQYRGRRLTYKLLTASGNSCWGYLTVEDKNPPLLDLENDTIACVESIPGVTLTNADCAYAPKVDFVDDFERFECDEDSNFVGIVNRKVWASDPWGNVAVDSYQIYIERLFLDSLFCPRDTVIECCVQKIVDGNLVDALWNSKYATEDEEGYAIPNIVIDPATNTSIGLIDPPYLLHDGEIVWLNQNYQHCNIAVKYKDHIIPACGSTYKIRREWLIKDWCSDMEETCIQWIKVVDTMAPVLDAPYGKTICLDEPNYSGDIVLAPLGVCELEDQVIGYDLTPNSGICEVPRTFRIKPHDCKGHVTIPRPPIDEECALKFAKDDAEKIEEALKEIKVRYQIKYHLHDEANTEVVVNGEIEHGEEALEYLPAGWYVIVYTIIDACWNETYACERIVVEDVTPPTPVCDELTQVTLDPNSCWTRIPAIELDDGSHDNCIDSLHFAIASMDSIEYYRNYWEEQLIECHGEYEYHHYYDYYQKLIERWINCFVFHDYVDLTECGTEMLVLRVYEAEGLPLLDPHFFNGTPHQWFCFNLYDEYACFYKYHYDEFETYEKDPRIDLCEYELESELKIVCEEGEKVIPTHPIVYSGTCQCDIFNNGFTISTGDAIDGCDPCEEGVVTLITNVGSQATAENIVGGVGIFDGLHGPQTNRACCVYESPDATEEQELKWAELLLKYPWLDYLDCKRYQFKHLYSDCMIEAIKDDKAPPVCEAPENLTIYCDGLDYWGSLFLSNDRIDWHGAAYAHDICEDEDEILANCFLDNSSDAPTVISLLNGPYQFCVKTPWDGGEHGYYGGPLTDGYTYYDENDCEDYVWGLVDSEGSYDWSPIYCRVWLLLDQFDDPNGQPIDPKTRFGTPDFTDNCDIEKIDSVTEEYLDQCGVGYITRTWTAYDKCENSASCYQTIHVYPRSDFEVEFPEDIVIHCEDVETLEIPDPIITDNECEQIGTTYKDEIFELNGKGCYKILRTWKVVNWCTYSPDVHHRYRDIIVDDRKVAAEDRHCVYRHLKDDGDGYMEYLQVIKVIDTVPPVIECEEEIEVCNFDENCEPHLTTIFLGTAKDNCSDDDAIIYRYIVKPEESTSASEYLYGQGNEIQAALPFGDHEVYFIAADGCGNEDTCFIDLYVRDCKKPTPYCHDGIATVIMPSSGNITIWASDFDAGSFDNCTADEDLIFSFDPEGIDTFRTFDCDDVPDNVSALIQLPIYVTDEEGNTDFCTVGFLLQDGSGDACKDISAIGDIGMGVKKGQKELKGMKGDIIEAKRPSGDLRSTLAANEYALYQNRPNPYQTETIIPFIIPETTRANLRVMDLTGRTVFQVSGTYAKGYHEWTLSKTELGIASGIFYYQIETEAYTATRKMIIVD